MGWSWTRAALAWGLCGCADQVVGTFDAVAGSTGGTTGGIATAVETVAEGADDIATSTTMGPGDVGPHPEICDGVDTDVGTGSEACGDCERLESPTHVYWVCTDELDWSTANAMCGTVGATSAIISAPAQTEFLLDNVDHGFFWLGAWEVSVGDWRWVDGAPLDYANWAHHQPDDADPGQDCLRLTYNIVDEEGWFHGAWDDFQCDRQQRVLCSAPHVVQ